MRSLNSNLLTLFLFSHLFCFHVVLVPAKVFISIDCGSSSPEPYTDDRSIVWVGDNQYVRTGEARNVIAKDIPDGWDSRVMSTLREFPDRSKNCYSLDVNNDKSEGKFERVLVRASFYNGNYDNNSDPPFFYLRINENFWAYVNTSMTGIVYKEVVYSLIHGNIINVCLIQLYQGIPFISALEVRSLDSDIYSYVDSNYPLVFLQREAYGTDTIVRYPEDSYDRIWNSIRPLGSNISDGGVVRVQNNSPSFKVNVADNVPEALFTTTLMQKNISITLWLNVSDNDDVENPNLDRHFNLYFSEVVELNSTQKRSFNITVYTYHDALDYFSIFRDYGPVIPPYGHALQFRIANVSAYSKYKIVLHATDDSNLPPLINGFEAYTIRDKLVPGTNSKDVKSLALLQKSFIQLQDWLGDPCLPSVYHWDWVACELETDSPRIIRLYLGNLGLVGTLPDFSDMDALDIIDLHNNSLTGEIPEFLGTFPKLFLLNLWNNNFSGAVPSSLLNNKDLTLRVSGNPNLSINKHSSSSDNKISSTIPIIVLGSAIIQMLDYIFGLLM